VQGGKAIPYQLADVMAALIIAPNGQFANIRSRALLMAAGEA
jgi:hypothetical protein